MAATNGRVRSGPRGQTWVHPNPKPQKTYSHRGITKTSSEWAELCGKTTGAIRGWERQGILEKMFDQALRLKGLMP
jgi:hypothetical protein